MRADAWQQYLTRRQRLIRKCQRVHIPATLARDILTRYRYCGGGYNVARRAIQRAAYEERSNRNG